MDATPEAFGYRCLPLNIADAHGWEVLTPSGFSAHWRGGATTADVIIRPDADKPAPVLVDPVRLEPAVMALAAAVRGGAAADVAPFVAAGLSEVAAARTVRRRGRRTARRCIRRHR